MQLPLLFNSLGFIATLEKIFSLSQKTSNTLDPSHKLKFNQYFTEGNVAKRLASRLSCHQTVIGDHGAGTGILGATAICSLLERHSDNLPNELRSYEIDTSLHSSFHECMAIVNEFAKCELQYSLEGDFLSACDDVLAKRRHSLSCAILNPPYKKLSQRDPIALYLKKNFCPAPNDYAAFIILTVDMLEPFGELVAIVPLIDNFAVIRHKKEISQNQYPQHEIVNVEPDIEQLESAQKLAEDLAMRVLTAHDYNESGIASRQFDIQMRKMTGLAKARACAASAKILLDRGLPVILFGYHRAVYQIWEEEFANYNPMFYTGKQTPSQKKRAKQAFIDGNTNLLIMSIRSGIGVDGLQYRAPWIVIGEFDWSKAVHIQNIGRGDRDGNPNPQGCGVIFVATNYGSDPIMQSILGIKSSQGRGIQDPKSGQTEVAINNQLTPGRFKDMAKSFLTSQGVTIPKDLISEKTNAELAELF